MPDSHPARLLAGKNQLGRIEKDALFEKVIGEVAPRRPRWMSWIWIAVPAVVATAAIVILLRPSRAGMDDFAPRGEKHQVAKLEPTCSVKREAPPTNDVTIGFVPSAVCARGDKLLLDVHGTTGYLFFAAFARSEADDSVIWYVDGKPLETRDGVYADAIVIGEEHRPGKYLVYGVFGRMPLTRDGIKAMFEDIGSGSLRPDVRVIVTGMLIQ